MLTNKIKYSFDKLTDEIKYLAYFKCYLIMLTDVIKHPDHLKYYLVMLTDRIKYSIPITNHIKHYLVASTDKIMSPSRIKYHLTTLTNKIKLFITYSIPKIRLCHDSTCIKYSAEYCDSLTYKIH